MSLTSFVSRRFFRSRQNDRFVSFISFISIVGVALGSAALIISLSVLGGFEREITQKIVGFTSHIQIQGFQNQLLDDPEGTVSLLEDSIRVLKDISPFVAREGIVRSREGVEGILLKGINPHADVLPVRRYLARGAYDLSGPVGDLPRLVVGTRLARRLAVEVGDKVAVFGLAGPIARGQMRAMQFRIVGLYESGMSEYDDVYAFTDIRDAQRLFQTGVSVTGYDVFLTSVDSAGVAAARIEELLGYPHYARTIYESYRNVFSWIELQKRPIPIILGLIIIVATVNIIGTLLMMVLGKARAIGVLMAMGTTRWTVSKIFLRQGMAIAVLGVLLGNFLAYALCLAQQEFRVLSLPSDIYFMSSVPILIRWEYFVVVSAVSLLLSFFCSLLPARLASRVDPVKAIRFA
jgi:lipoprotein-releasing system permease protein